MSDTVGSILARGLEGLGVERIYGVPVAGLDRLEPTPDGAGVEVVPVDDPDLAVLMADVDGRLGGGLGAALVPGGVLHLSSKPGGTAHPKRITDVDELVAALVELDDHRHLPTTVAFHLDLDLTAPATVPVDVDRGPEAVIVTLNPNFADARLVIVVGPGVTRGSYGRGLRSLVGATGAGVVNTWGAKGVFRWDSPIHFGTAGLQERDFELAGVADADLVIASGIDPDETPLDRFGTHLVQEVEPWQLAALTYQWGTRADPPTERPALYRDIAAVVTPMYESTAVPITPPRAALHLSGACPEGGVVVADPGVAGFWIARTFPTGIAGSVVVPATVQPGFAAAAALVCGLIGRPCIAVVDGVAGGDGPDGALDEATHIVLDTARLLGVPVALQVWGERGTLDDVDAHAHLATAQLAAGGVQVAEVPVDPGGLDALVDVAGPVVAWGGLTPRSPAPKS